MIADILWTIGTGFACFLAVFALLQPFPRRRRRHWHLISPRRNAGSPTPGALRDLSRPADPIGAGERRGFSCSTTTENHKPQ